MFLKGVANRHQRLARVRGCATAPSSMRDYAHRNTLDEHGILHTSDQDKKQRAPVGHIFTFARLATGLQLTDLETPSLQQRLRDVLGILVAPAHRADE